MVLKMESVSPNELAAAPHFPRLVQKTAREPLAPRAAAKDHDVTTEKNATRLEIDHRFARQPSTIKQNRLGWQEFENGVRRE